MCGAMSVFDIEYTAVPWEWEDMVRGCVGYPS